MLTEDAVVSMPPAPEWHQGHEAVRAFLRARHLQRGRRNWRFVPVGANGQTAYAYYLAERGRLGPRRDLRHRRAPGWHRIDHPVR
jgi:hypothetical protein